MSKKINHFDPKLRILEKQKSRDIDALNVEMGYMTVKELHQINRAIPKERVCKIIIGVRVKLIW
jgi:hypothetical protein